MNDLQFRQMSVGDIPDVLEIEKEGFLSGWSFDGYRNELLREDSLTILVENKGEIAGFIITRLITSARESEILNIAVKRKFRRRGIATVLLNKTVAFLNLSRIKSVWLEVRKTNFTAQELYRRNGFVVCGERKNFYTNPIENALVMKLDL